MPIANFLLLEYFRNNKTFNETLQEAGKQAIKIEEDWLLGNRIYIFKDGSMLEEEGFGLWVILEKRSFDESKNYF